MKKLGKIYRLAMNCAFVLSLVACGAGSNDATYIVPRDSVSSTATIFFDPADSAVVVTEKGDDAKSELIEACKFSMDPITGRLSYELVDADHLTLGTGSFTYKRALESPKKVAGVLDRIFSVWAAPETESDNVVLNLELEIQPTQLIFRMDCTG